MSLLAFLKHVCELLLILLDFLVHLRHLSILKQELGIEVVLLLL